ncbi:MAG: endonuclease III [Planctomycetota bacterium]
MTEDAAKLKAKVRRIIAALEKRFGAPKVRRGGDLIGSFVLTMLSQHTSDVNAARAFEILKSKFPEWENVAGARPSAIARAIRSAGLANQKSGRIRDFVRWVKATFGGYDLSALKKMPADEIAKLLTSVNGIGIKTVSVVMLFSLGRDVFPVDTHVHRISRRVGLVPGKATAERTHRLMAPLIAKGKSMSLHVNFLRLGRTICHARGPLCAQCPLRKLCGYAAERNDE